MNFYLIFHHNLAFSSIPEEHYPYLIDSVYSKLLDLVEAGHPLGLEYTGETLEIINFLRPKYVERLKASWWNGNCEVIGSSYSQAIFPLIPAEVNRWNLTFGNEVFARILGRIPTIYYLNEQVYSESLPAIYRQANAKAIVFDWMSASKDKDWPVDYRYRIIRHTPSGVLFLWGDSIAYQKLQRTIWGDMDFDEWLRFVIAHCEQGHKQLGNNSSFCLYASDAEVFDYYPGGLTTYGAQQGHFDKLHNALDILKKIGGKLVVPGLILEKQLKEIPEVNNVASPSYPVLTKKQDKYNVTRWAVTGREATKMNTQCNQLFGILQRIENNEKTIKRVTCLQKELVTLWGSDFRTHTTDEKYEAFHNRMGQALGEGNCLIEERDQSTCKPYSIRFEEKDKEVEHWRPLDARAMLDSAGIELQGRRVKVLTNGTTLTLLKNKGLAVDALTFHTPESNFSVGTIPHGHFADISLGSDFYSGHLILVTRDGHQYTDLSCHVDKLEFCFSGSGIGLRNMSPMEFPGLSLQKTFRLNDKQCSLVYDLYAKNLHPASLRLGIWTLQPNSFDNETLYYQTHQGGDCPERHLLFKTSVNQDQPVNPVVTARHCLGNTSGVLRLGDARKWIQIKTFAEELYSVPLLHYEVSPAWNHKESFLSRVYYSICERDDVASVFWKGHLRISFTLTAGKTIKASPLHDREIYRARPKT